MRYPNMKKKADADKEAAWKRVYDLKLPHLVDLPVNEIWTPYSFEGGLHSVKSALPKTMKNRKAEWIKLIKELLP